MSYGHEIIATEAELLDQRRTVYRVKLKPDSYRHIIPETATSVIVKQQKDGWEEEFEDEETAYNKLKVLQGKVIPYFYGRGDFDGLPALILSDIDGIPLDDLALSNYDISESSLKAYLEEVLSQFLKHGALYRDQKLNNFLFCDSTDCGSGKVMAVDLEQVEFPDRFRPWHYSVSQQGARSLMEDFRYKRSPGRESSPLELCMSGHDESGPLAELDDFSLVIYPGSIGKPVSTQP
ncbi:hypothetical protein BO94DRAFT_543271 [Aspergillus sclerotioniger CBS 115572]|uniref:Protein kinase domain-containing protein n=1 Tax=Aspergillus sclerotioniger CBS 115572 TaxID=1450535 RepID=A0A317X6P8_9EURO|nr:hypothetical protein BO94DRAFT_543271 [Aspergillus sclerotioniger CBS 115572]PWY94005.1 hypothetical protein BO94DRAFT_543271 [Aspergillus sclerotioniger CBS 115572]